jgi:hypothetical protein
MLNPWYVSGFCDGEAAFTYSKSAETFALYFSIKQRGENRRLIEEIQQYFHNVGNIYLGKDSTSSQNRDFFKPSVFYRVTKINELKVIIDHFDRYPLQSKKKLEAYGVWRQMVLYKLENYRDIDYNKLKTLAEKLSGLNCQSGAFKLHIR